MLLFSMGVSACPELWLRLVWADEFEEGLFALSFLLHSTRVPEGLTEEGPERRDRRGVLLTDVDHVRLLTAGAENRKKKAEEQNEFFH